RYCRGFRDTNIYTQKILKEIILPNTGSIHQLKYQRHKYNKKWFWEDPKNVAYQISFTLEESTCHKILYVNRTQPNGEIIVGPSFFEQLQCEWWIEAPEGNHVKLSLIDLYLGKFNDNYVAINENGDTSYPYNSTRVYGQGTMIPRTFVSTKSRIAIVLQGDFSAELKLRYEMYSCSDTDTECEYWAADGECKKNPMWMHRFCRKSCNRCEYAATCINKHEDCVFWAANAQCQENNAWMTVHCKLACRYCDRCWDAHVRCPKWRYLGECERNPGYMRTFCRRTCGFCVDDKSENITSIEVKSNTVSSTPLPPLPPTTKAPSPGRKILKNRNKNKNLNAENKKDIHIRIKNKNTVSFDNKFIHTKRNITQTNEITEEKHKFVKNSIRTKQENQKIKKTSLKNSKINKIKTKFSLKNQNFTNKDLEKESISTNTTIEQSSFNINNYSNTTDEDYILPTPQKLTSHLEVIDIKATKEADQLTRFVFENTTKSTDKRIKKKKKNQVTMKNINSNETLELQKKLNNSTLSKNNINYDENNENEKNSVNSFSHFNRKRVKKTMKNETDNNNIKEIPNRKINRRKFVEKELSKNNEKYNTNKKQKAHNNNKHLKNKEIKIKNNNSSEKNYHEKEILLKIKNNSSNIIIEGIPVIKKTNISKEKYKIVNTTINNKNIDSLIINDNITSFQKSKSENKTYSTGKENYNYIIENLSIENKNDSNIDIIIHKDNRNISLFEIDNDSINYEMEMEERLQNNVTNNKKMRGVKSNKEEKDKETEIIGNMIQFNNTKLINKEKTYKLNEKHKKMDNENQNSRERKRKLRKIKAFILKNKLKLNWDKIKENVHVPRPGEWIPNEYGANIIEIKKLEEDKIQEDKKVSSKKEIDHSVLAKNISKRKNETDKTLYEIEREQKNWIYYTNKDSDKYLVRPGEWRQQDEETHEKHWARPGSWPPKNYLPKNDKISASSEILQTKDVKSDLTIDDNDITTVFSDHQITQEKLEERKVENISSISKSNDFMNVVNNYFPKRDEMVGQNSSKTSYSDIILEENANANKVLKEIIMEQKNKTLYNDTEMSKLGNDSISSGKVQALGKSTKETQSNTLSKDNNDKPKIKQKSIHKARHKHQHQHQIRSKIRRKKHRRKQPYKVNEIMIVYRHNDDKIGKKPLKSSYKLNYYRTNTKNNNKKGNVRKSNESVRHIGLISDKSEEKLKFSIIRNNGNEKLSGQRAGKIKKSSDRTRNPDRNKSSIRRR
ncbi:unnamed protein product, partial [Meganyctiphanes norvegica]